MKMLKLSLWIKQIYLMNKFKFICKVWIWHYIIFQFIMIPSNDLSFINNCSRNL